MLYEKRIRIIVHLSTSRTNEVADLFTHYFSMKIKFHRRILSKMDKMNKNEFYNRINPKISIPAWSKNSKFISKDGLFLKMIAKTLKMITKIASTRKEKLHIRNEFYNEFHFCCFGCNLVQIPL